MNENSKEKIKIGLLVSNEKIRKPYYDMIHNLSNKVNFIVINSDCDYSRFEKSNLSLFKRILKTVNDISWKVYLKFEFFRTKVKWEQCNLTDLKLKRIKITGIYSKSKLIVKYENLDIIKIKKQEFDLLLRINVPGIFKGEILNSSRLGLLSMHHGDNRWNRGVPAGFWEVYYKKPESGYIFQILNEVLDGGKVVFRGVVSTSSNYTSNYLNLFNNSVFFLEKFLLKISTNRELPECEDQYGYDGQLFRKPNVCQILSLLIKISYRKLVYKLYPNPVWNVYFKNTDIKSSSFNNFTKIKNPKDRWVADPFLFKFNEITYLFVEDYDVKLKKGSISVYALNKNKYEFLGKVLEEEFHLSYPFIFNYDGDIYMIPETKEDETIRLYKAIDFPMNWKFEKFLMTNIKSVDTTILKTDNNYWMFTNQEISNNTRNTCLFLYKSSSPISTIWTEHKDNPIEFKNGSRNAGLVNLPNKTLRVGQKFGFMKYGKSICLYESNLINLENYSEELVHEYKPKFDQNIRGMHHINNNEDYVTFDAFRNKLFIER